MHESFFEYLHGNSKNEIRKDSEEKGKKRVYIERGKTGMKKRTA